MRSYSLACTPATIPIPILLAQIVVQSLTDMPAHPHLGYINPVIGHDFADPGVFFDRASQTWYAFGTNGNGKNIQCSYTKDFCCWEHHEHDCLPGPLPSYQSGTPGFLWAPEVIEAPQGRGGYLMYVSCQDAIHKKQCIGVAYSDRDPKGPYRWITDRPLISRVCIQPNDSKQ
ncbi:uncharacterized protein PAN0_183c6835 [Moesziomyces antarcticus]|uniref:Uncharacterized protein n=1 Tax=Pseudozyma antarctica TaxID=84753 RepID=A0A081CPG8_PSEA2|nr:uncharacterized protein PAN0_183c6835 [Moesziomyces antarcticus]GAK68564.1 hypothetical protein PAN0_183c6835 [Moesziomyces antarcticus]